MKKFIPFICIYLLPFTFYATTWRVGADQTYTTPSAVVNLVQNGDTIKIDGGIYLNDPVQWGKTNLVFIGLGTGNDRTTMRWNGGDISNGKGIWVFGDPNLTGNITIDNIVFEGARVSDNDGGNGAGVRYQAKNLTIRNCQFNSCQNGILEGGSYTGSIVSIQNSEFYNNGYEVTGGTYSGYEHNIYISAQTDSLLVTNCYFHDPRGEANSLKTRALKSFILYNLIDEANGQGSWELNIAQGGLSVIIGNTIIQGAGSINHGIIGYDAATNPIENFYFINNTVINKYSGNFNFFNVVPSSGITKFKIYNNIFATVSSANLTNFIAGSPVGSALDTLKNSIIPDYTTIGFVNTINDDYHLTSAAVSVLNNCVNAGTASNGFSLTPVNEYDNFASPLTVRMTSGSANDRGAFEYPAPTSNNDLSRANAVSFFVWCNNNNINIGFKDDGVKYIAIYDITGKQVQFLYNQRGNRVTLSSVNLANGIYIAKVKEGEMESVRKFIISQ